MGKKRVATKFLKALAARLETRVASDTRLQQFIDALCAGCKGRIGKSPGKQPAMPLLATRSVLLQSATVEGEEFRDVLSATSEAVDWFQSYMADELGADFAASLVAAQVAGNRGLLSTDEVFAGFFLIGPNTTYPLHDHVSDELYFVVSGSVAITNGFEADARELNPGDYSVTPSGMPHKLQTRDAPVMMLYVWAGAVDCDVYWWTHEAGDTWRRTVPTRASR